MSALLLAIDVGTAMARAGAFDESGRVVAVGACPLELLHPGPHQAVYRKDAVWHAVCVAIRQCLSAEPELGMRVVGLGFDAAPSLVLDYEGAAPLDGGADVFAWTDRRAVAEAAGIGDLGGAFYPPGSGVSAPEGHLAKLLWLKRHGPDIWARVTAVRDLADEMARRATGNDRHSQATLAARWPYHAGQADPWQHGFLAAIGLDDVCGLGSLAGDPVVLGQAHGALDADVAAFLGLPPGIPVSPGMLDAEAGLLGSIGRNPRGRLDGSVALVGDGATPFMALSAVERQVPGVWGPYADALLPGLWVYEGGQSYSGAALDAVLERHPAGPLEASVAGHAAAAEVLALLDAEGPRFAADRHVVPDWLGNRAPLGDAGLRGLATGLGADGDHRSFLEEYYATARGLALQARQVIGHFNAHGFAIDRVTLAGGQARNPLLVRLYRDALGCGLVVPRHDEAVLLGTAMAAAAAAGVHADLFAAIELMSPAQAQLAPDPFWRRAHDAAYAIYLKLADARDAAARAADGLAGMVRQAAR